MSRLLIVMLSLVTMYPCVSAQADENAAQFKVDADYSGGNILLDRIEGSNVFLQQDLRDTAGWWFYWNFRVIGAGGQTLTFYFINKNVIGTRGPAVSLDRGETWTWLGDDTVKLEPQGTCFTYTFVAEAQEVRFAFAPPYQQTDLKRFLHPFSDHSSLTIDSLCTTANKRSVERLRIVSLQTMPKYRLFLTCRHHACESVASYALEGALAAILGDTETGCWFVQNVETIVIPFMDKDGVEQGDQGKNRIPHDHGRDYGVISIYTSIRALREMIVSRTPELPTVVLDLHCPGIRGKAHERVFLVGSQSSAIWQQQCKFSELLEKTSHTLLYDASDNLPFGQSWNTGQNRKEGLSLAGWAGELNHVLLASTIEIPYANTKNLTVTPETARTFGADLASAIRQYLEGSSQFK